QQQYQQPQQEQQYQPQPQQNYDQQPPKQQQYQQPPPQQQYQQPQQEEQYQQQPPQQQQYQQQPPQQYQQQPQQQPQQQQPQRNYDQQQQQLHQQLHQHLHQNLQPKHQELDAQDMVGQQASISSSSSQTEVRTWLESNGFSTRTCNVLWKYDAESLFNLSKDELEDMLGYDESYKLDSLLKAYKSKKQSYTAELEKVLRNRREMLDL
ncbi:hypothetical protein Ahia01_000407200, partial [Argonauta hians]